MKAEETKSNEEIKDILDEALTQLDYANYGLTRDILDGLYNYFSNL